MRRVLVAVLASLLIAGFVAPAVAAAHRPRRGVVPEGRRHRRAGRRGHGPLPRGGARSRRARPPLHPGRHRDLLAQRDVAGRQGRAPGRQPRHLHGPRQRLAEQVPQQPLPADPERLRAQPEPRRRRRHPPVLRRGADRRGRQARQERRRAAQPPVLRVGQQRAGLAEGTLGQARQRVDNFAAGFIAAGAVGRRRRGLRQPEPHGPRRPRPASAPSRRPGAAPDGERQRLRVRERRAAPGTSPRWIPSATTPGSRARSSSRQGLASADVLRERARQRGRVPRRTGRRRRARPEPGRRAGSTLGAPTLSGSTVGRRQDQLPAPVHDRRPRQAAEDVQASVRWDLLEAAAIRRDRARPRPAEPAAVDRPDDRRRRTSALVIARAARRRRRARASSRSARSRWPFHVATPAAPGRYRLTVTLHDADGVAYDPATQAQVPSLIVRVTGDLDAGDRRPGPARPRARRRRRPACGSPTSARHAWGHEAVRRPAGIPRAPSRRQPRTLTGTWVALGGVDDPAQLAAADAASVKSADAAGRLRATVPSRRRSSAVRPERRRVTTCSCSTS